MAKVRVIRLGKCDLTKEEILAEIDALVLTIPHKEKKYVKQEIMRAYEEELK